MWQSEIPEIDFSARRKAIYSKLKDAVLVLPSAPVTLRNHDVAHPYRQDSDFFYVTGFEEAESLAMLAPQSETPYQIFVKPRDPKEELWNGKTIGPDVVKTLLKPDAALASSPDSIFDQALIAALGGANRIYYRVGKNEAFDRRVFRLLDRAKRSHGRSGGSIWPICDPNEIISELRLLKSKAEVERLQRACEISVDAHINAPVDLLCL